MARRPATAIGRSSRRCAPSLATPIISARWSAIGSRKCTIRKILQIAPWLVGYPFADRLFPNALNAVRHVERWGPPVILSDGDAVFQPVKIHRAGLARAFSDRVLIYIHKEQELAAVERHHPARRYVLIDDKLRILSAVKEAWGERVTTVFVAQGHYARDKMTLAQYPAADRRDRRDRRPRHDRFLRVTRR